MPQVEMVRVEERRNLCYKKEFKSMWIIRYEWLKKNNVKKLRDLGSLKWNK